jgi:hypothetical protein
VRKDRSTSKRSEASDSSPAANTASAVELTRSRSSSSEVVALDSWARSLCTGAVSQTNRCLVPAERRETHSRRETTPEALGQNIWEQKDADAPQGGVGKVTLGGGSQMIVTVSGGGSLTRPT